MQAIESPEVAAAFESYPPKPRRKLLALRDLILETAKSTEGVGRMSHSAWVRTRAVSTLVLLLGIAWPPSAPLAGGESPAQILAPPSSIEWGPPPPKLPPGARFAVLLGDPAQPGGLYVFRVKLPDGYAVPPHVHPMDEHVTVIEGTMRLGFGATRDDSVLQDLPAGSYVRLPQGVPHFNRMKGPTILQFHGIGPFDITYLDPEDDPSRP